MTNRDLSVRTGSPLSPANEVSDTNINDLRQEAGAAGDHEQVRLCDLALNGDMYAWDICVAVIREARREWMSDPNGLYRK